MGVTQAEDFLTRCFHPEETIALLLRREEPARVIQRIVRLEQAAAPAYLRWLAYENANRLNVYVAANPLLQGSRKRTKECIAEVRHLYLDIDCDGDARVAAVRASDGVPEPTAIISTSPGKYQVLWRVAGFGFEQQEHMLKLLSQTFGGDSACTDCNRVIRVPGFHNAKYTPAHPVTVEYLSGSAAKPEDFRLAESSPSAVLPLRGSERPVASPKRTHSEQDWAWALAELTKGTDAAELTRALAVRRADKPNPLYYAQRTIDLAFARLALLGGMAPEAVVSMLEERRSSELSSPLCSSRAREIAMTATRMIARRTVA